jgi:hypothetical protein
MMRVVPRTAGQRTYLDFNSWSLNSQQKVAAGYVPQRKHAAQMQTWLDEEEKRERGEACRRSY